MEGKLIKTGDQFLLRNKEDEVIAITSGTMEGRMLSLKNCQAIELGYDLNELALSHVNDHLIKGTDEYHNSQVDFKEGFQKALEILGDKKFSVEDVISMIEKSRETGLTAEYLVLTKQQTEWDVEVCCQNDCYGDYTTCKKSSFECKICTNTGIPKLDTNGCLILKRK